MTASDPIVILTLLCLCIAVADGLSRLRGGHLPGAPVLSLLLAAVLSNLGLLPSGAQSPALYAGIFVVVAPMAIFYLLLDAHLRQLRERALPMLLVFLIAAMGTLIAVVVAAGLTHLDDHLGDAGRQLAAAMTANLIGSGAEYDVLAQQLHLTANAPLYRAGLSLNALLASLWIVLCSLLPAVLQTLPRYRHGAWIAGHSHTRHATSESHRAHEQLASLGAFALLLVLGLAAYGLSEATARVLARLGVAVPSILLIGLFALGLAQTGLPSRLPGSKALGRFGVCLFLAVLGTQADVMSLLSLGSLGALLSTFVLIVLAIHLALLVAVGYALRLDPDLLAIASQAGIGGASTAMAVAESRQRHDLAMPAIIAGSVGNALGVTGGLLALRLLGG